jgi:hypothetical protein
MATGRPARVAQNNAVTYEIDANGRNIGVRVGVVSESQQHA